MPPKPINIIPPKKEIKKFTGVGNNPTSIDAVMERERQAREAAQRLQAERARRAAEDAAKKAQNRGSSASSVLEPEFSLYQQLLAKFTKQEEGQKFQTQVEIPPKGNNNN